MPSYTRFIELPDGEVLIKGGAFDGDRVKRCPCTMAMTQRNRPVGLVKVGTEMHLCHLDCLANLRVGDREAA